MYGPNLKVYIYIYILQSTSKTILNFFKVYKLVEVNIYHLEIRWRNSVVLVYHGPENKSPPLGSGDRHRCLKTTVQSLHERKQQQHKTLSMHLTPCHIIDCLVGHPFADLGGFQQKNNRPPWLQVLSRKIIG